MERTSKKQNGFIGWFKENWAHNSLFSTVFALFVMVVIQSIVMANIDRAPLFTGIIKGKGPRYCPSFEDKVVRFAHKSELALFRLQSLGGSAGGRVFPHLRPAGHGKPLLQ